MQIKKDFMKISKLIVILSFFLIDFCNAFAIKTDCPTDDLSYVCIKNNSADLNLGVLLMGPNQIQNEMICYDNNNGDGASVHYKEGWPVQDSTIPDIAPKKNFCFTLVAAWHEDPNPDTPGDNSISGLDLIFYNRNNNNENLGRFKYLFRQEFQIAEYEKPLPKGFSIDTTAKFKTQLNWNP